MAKKIKPEDVAKQFDWAIDDLTDFCANVLEDANDHNVAATLRAMNCGDYGLARDFIQLEEDQVKAGELTQELYARRNSLLDRLKRACDGESSS